MQPRVVSNHIVFTHTDHNLITNVFPLVKHNPSHQLYGVPNTIDNAIILNNMGVPAPSPILTDYNWAGSFEPRWYQKEAANFFTLNMRAFNLSQMRCVDKETEFLTPTGWKKIPDYAEGDQVAQWSEKSHRISFVEPLEYIKTPCDEFIHFKTAKGIDQMLTAHHRVPYYDTGMNFKESTAAAIHEINTKNKRGWEGRLPTTFRPPINFKGLPLNRHQIRVMVAVIADGYFPSPSSNRCQIRLKKERKKERLRELLTAAGIDFMERSKDYNSAVGYTVFTFTAPRRDKVFTSDWWKCNEKQLYWVYDEVVHWDSSKRKVEGSFTFSTHEKESADFIQYASISAGRCTASLSVNTREVRGKSATEYTVHVLATGNPLYLKATTSEGVKIQTSNIVPSEDGFCYCFSVPTTYIVFRRNGRVFVSGNTGKTLTHLWSADFLKQKGKIRKVLIAAPLSTLERVWGDNLFTHFHRRKFAILHGSAQKRRDLLNSEADFYVINHHGVGILEQELMDRQDIDLVIIDELGKSYRNATTSIWKSMKRIITPNRWAWGLTGNPTPNEPTDAYAQAKLIKPENLGSLSFTRFKNDTMQQFGPFRWVPRKGAEQTISKILQPSVRFTRDVCTDMEQCFVDRTCELSPEQRKHFDKLMKEAVTEVKGQTITAVNAAVLISKLVQTACGVMYSGDGKVEIDFGPRLALLEELIEENDEKVLVMVPFTGVLQAVKRELSKRWSCEVVDGSVHFNKRNQIFHDFQKTPSPHIIVAHPECMAHGLELTAASLVIWYAPHNNNDQYDQANARIDGSGQKVKMDVARIYATRQEKRIYDNLQAKGNWQDLLLDLI